MSDKNKKGPESKTYKFDTLSLHAGYQPHKNAGSRQVPIYQTTSYLFDDVDHAAALFNLERGGHIYSRISNPTVGVLEERVASLEGGTAALATSNGAMNAQQKRGTDARSVMYPFGTLTTFLLVTLTPQYLSKFLPSSDNVSESNLSGVSKVQLRGGLNFASSKLWNFPICLFLWFYRLFIIYDYLFLLLYISFYVFHVECKSFK